MRPTSERQVVAHLTNARLNASQIAGIAGIPRSTVREWMRQPNGAPRGHPLALDVTRLPEPDYSYLLGFYLGDGCISAHARGVYRLRITTDATYPQIIEECARAMRAVMPQNRVQVQQLRTNAVEIGSYSKAWPLLFPQHGPGRKHKRKIELAPWQARIVEHHTREFLRGMIHSDGCRVLNRVNGKDYPRYLFVQISDDIRQLFCSACRLLGVEYTRSSWKTISVARRGSVALLDSFIGPKA